MKKYINKCSLFWHICTHTNCQSHRLSRALSYSKGGRSLRDESRLTTDGGPGLPGLSGGGGCGDIPTGGEWSLLVTSGQRQGEPGHRSDRTVRGKKVSNF